MKKVLSFSLGLIFIGNFLFAQTISQLLHPETGIAIPHGALAVGVYPGAAAGNTGSVTIPTGFAVTLNVSPANPIGSLAIAVGNGNNSLTVSNAFTLNVTGGILINAGSTGGSWRTKSIVMNGLVHN